MKLRSLRITRAPGIIEPFGLDDLPDGLIVIEGPNGIGKTSLCTAVDALLWPSAKKPGRAAHATWVNGEGQQLSTTLVDAQCTWQLGGTDVQPRLPAPQFASCFSIRVDEVIAAGTADAVMAAGIARDIAGGYDLTAIRKGDPPTGLKALKDEALTSDKALRTAQQEQAKDFERVLTLSAREELASAKQARTLVAPLDKAVELAKQRLLLSGSVAERDTYPPHMDLLRDTDAETLALHENAVVALWQRIEAATELKREAETEIAGAALPDNNPVPAKYLDAWDRWLPKVEAREAAVAEAATAIAHAGARITECHALVGENFPGIATLDLQALQRVQRCAIDIIAATAACNAQETFLSGLPQAQQEEQPGIDALAAAHQVLLDWLAAPEQRTEDARPSRGLIALFAIACLLALAAGLIGKPAPLSQGLALLTAAIAAVGAVIASRKPGVAETASTARRDAEERYRARKLDAPEEWSRERVSERQLQLQAQIALRAKQDELGKAAGEAKRMLEGLVEKEAEAQEACDALGQKLGISVPADSMEIAVRLDALHSALEAESILAGLEAAQKERERRIGAALAAFHARFSPFLSGSLEPPANAAEAMATLKDLKRRTDALNAGITDLKNATRDIADLTEKIVEAKRAITAFLMSRRCESRQELEERLERLQDWYTLTGKINTAKANIARLEGELSGHPDILNLTTEDAQERRNALENIDEVIDGLQKEIAEIQALRARREAETTIQTALANAAEALRKLEEAREKTMRGAARQFLVDSLRKVEADQQPAVLRNASDHLSAFTAGRYTLLLDRANPAAPAYRALDTVSQTGHSLNTLSGGTRVQLLLAARLALASREESADPLPIFLDEILKHSDPERFTSIVRSLYRMALDGRQVFYLTSDPAETARMERDLQAIDPNFSLHRIDLAEVRRQAAWKGSIPPIPVRSVPAPGEFTPEEYAEQLQAPPIDARHPEAAHLVYLMADDLPSLYALLRAGVETLGQMEALEPVTLSSMGAKADSVATALDLGQVLKEYLRARAENRPEPVTLDILRSAGCSANFLAQVEAVFARYAGDIGSALSALRAGRVTGFGRTKIDAIENWLRESGYLPEDPPLDSAEIRTRVLNRCAGLPVGAERVARYLDWLAELVPSEPAA